MDESTNESTDAPCRHLAHLFLDQVQTLLDRFQLADVALPVPKPMMTI